MHHNKYLSKYNRGITKIIIEEEKRGAIYDSKQRPMALNYKVYDMFVDPKTYIYDMQNNKNSIEKYAQFFSYLSNKFHIDKNAIIKKIYKNGNKHYFVIIRNISYKDYNEINYKFVPRAFGLIKRYKRYYPDGEYSAHIIGFCDRDGKGIEGLEKYYNYYLKRSATKKRVKLDIFKDKKVANSKNSYSLYTTINKDIQDFVHINLYNTIERYNADYGMVVVMNPNNGAVIAMDSYPFYNNNRYYSYEYKYIKNRAVTDVFEPGSIFKLVTLSAALNSKKFKGNELINCEKGRFRIGNKIIHDVHRFKILSFDNVFVKSSNIGSAKIAIKLGAKTFYKYLMLYGFGEKTKIDTVSESKGIVKDILSISKLELANMAFGQGIGVTAIQIARAYSVIANGGYRVKPHFMNKLSNGKISIKYKDKKIKILNDETVARIKKILRNVVLKGTGKRAVLRDYSTSGKTGTAQIPYKGKYNKNEYIASFAGYAPADNPRFVVTVYIVNPKNGYFYGGEVAAPLFAKIEGFLLHYYGVEPDINKSIEQ